MHYADFHEAFPSNLSQVFHEPDHINAPRNQPSRERLNVGFTIASSVERVCYLASRRTNIVFNFAEALWYLSGDNSLAFIAYYAKSIAIFSRDGETLTGTAYGPRVFACGARRIDQWKRVVELLSSDDPDSKRAVLQIFRAEETLTSDNIDVACTLALQFLIRGGRLHLISTMRANDAFRGIVSDVFSFTFLQEVMARQLDVAVGPYYHNVGSMHVYDSDAHRVREVLHEVGEAGLCRRPWSFPQMPRGNNWPWIKRLLELERILRHGESDPVEVVRESDLPDYWLQVLMLLAFYRRHVVDRESIDRGFLAGIWPVYRWFLRHRWPELGIPTIAAAFTPPSADRAHKTDTVRDRPEPPQPAPTID